MWVDVNRVCASFRECKLGFGWGKWGGGGVSGRCRWIDCCIGGLVWRMKSGGGVKSVGIAEVGVFECE